MSDARHLNLSQTAASVPSLHGPQAYPPRVRLSAKIVTFGIDKGGTGKSTLVASMAVCALNHGLSVVTLDLDPRGDLVGWGNARNGASPNVIEGDASHLHDTIQTLRSNGSYDLILIDTAGTESMLNVMAMRAADLCLVPFGLNIFDVRAALKMAEAHKRAQREFALVLTKCPAHRGRVETVRAALASIGEFAGVPFVNRVAHHDAMALGLGVTELDAGGQAAAEVEALWSFVEAKLWL